MSSHMVPYHVVQSNMLRDFVVLFLAPRSRITLQLLAVILVAACAVWSTAQHEPSALRHLEAEAPRIPLIISKRRSSSLSISPVIQSLLKPHHAV